MAEKFRHWVPLAVMAVVMPVRAPLFAQLAGDGSPSDAMHVRAAAEALRSTYDSSTGLFMGTGWWNSANGISALARVSRNLKTHDYDGIFENTFRAAPRRFPGFLNEFYDDEGWWALAWLDVYQLNGDARYLGMSERIFDDMSGGWSGTCGGGIWWKKNEHYKNAIANELFLAVAVRLAVAGTGANRGKYAGWAQKEEQWFLGSGMINGQDLVNDGLDASCRNNGRTTWTYNQGVILTGLQGYSELTHDTAAMAEATRIATAAAQKLTDAHGILHDPCEPNCGEDGPQFKGIFVRDVSAFVQGQPMGELQKLLQANAESVWDHARTEGNHFSVNWGGPPKDDGTASLISALDALAALLHGEAPRVAKRQGM